jgi:RHS repeat-associated protein
MSTMSVPAAAATPVRPAVPVTPSVKDVKDVIPKSVAVPNPAARRHSSPRPMWPSASSAVLRLSTASTTASSSVGTVVHAKTGPSWAQMASGSSAGQRRAANTTSNSIGGPTALRVTTASHQTATRADIVGVILRVTPTAGSAGAARVGLDYSAFADAYGGGFGSRLRMVGLPACVLATPQLSSCRKETPLASQNDAAAQSVSAVLTFGSPVDGSTRVIAATASTVAGDGGGPGGTYSATTLKPSGSWAAGGSSGSFTYSYPIQVPPAASSLVPTVSLDYDSGSVDGQTAANQSQSSWVGDGWSSSTDNFVEQSFVSCSDSPEGTAVPSATSDNCYDGPVLTLSLDGSTTSLVQSGGTWKSTEDNGDVVRHVSNSGNGSGTHDTDYWTVTDRTGTTFSFGLNKLPGWASGEPTTNSVQSEPVYSAHAGDPCFSTAGFTQSACTMAYRWNLDYVKDPHGNAMAYYYKQDTNAYAQDGRTTSAVSYVRDSHLDHIDYGFTDGNAYSGNVPDDVLFQTAERCMTGTCDPLNATTAPNWPDVPQYLQCSSGAACQVAGPSFYSTVRLTAISTRQWNGTAWVTVDSWSLAQHFPPTGDGYAPALWLDSITHVGSDTSAGGSAVRLPPVSFAGIALANRVDTTVDGLEPLNRYRISAVTSETGAVTGVDYELTTPCSAPVTLSPSTNTSSCFPVSWTPDGFTTPITDWFNKYAVKSVSEADNTAHSPTMLTSYQYLGGGAWHYDDNEVVQAKYRTWGQWRGYHEVQTRTGTAPDPLTLADSTYYRGMDGDTLPGGNTRSVTLTDSQGGQHVDADPIVGEVLEDTSYLGDGGPVDHSTITSYWVSAATAGRTRLGLPELTANAVEPVEVWTRQAITDTATTTWRKTETDTTYDTDPADVNFGLATFEYDHGDLADSSQRRCTASSYAPANTTSNIVGLEAEVEVDAQPCGGANPNGASAPTAAQTNALTTPTTLSRPADVISDTRTFYDNAALAVSWPQPTNPVWPQAAPSFGDPSVVRKATDYTGGAFVYQTSSAKTYDSFGRATNSWDADGHETTTSYTMTNGVTTASRVTNPANQAVATTLDPYRGIPTLITDVNNVATTLHYDGIGRLISQWDNGRTTTHTANETYTYAVSGTAPTVITINTLNREQAYKTSTQIFDAMLRPAQTQAPTPQGGRLVTNTAYDSHGWVVKKNNAWWDPATTPNATLVTAADNLIPNQDRYILDGLGRTVVDRSDQFSVPQQITTTVYSGDRTTVIPPHGGITQTTATDALDRTTELDQYTTAPTVTAPSDTFSGRWSVTSGVVQATKTKYNPRGEVADTIDPAGDDWSSSYDLAGQVTSKQDPDAGASTMTYDPVGNLTSTTDANGHTTSYVYDALDRKVAEYNAPVSGQASANELAAWTYDGPATSFEVGKLVSSTAYVGGTAGTAYTEASEGYNAFGESLGETVTIPATTALSKDAAGQSTAVTSAGAATIGGTYEFDKDYDTVIGLRADDDYPAAGGLPGEDVSYGYSGTLDLPSALSRYASATGYDAFGHVTQETLNTSPNFAFITNSYDTHTGLLTDTATSRTVTPTAIDDTSYAYDPAGNITSQTETRQGTTSETQCYTYDQLDRLNQAWTATDSCAAAPTTNGAAPNVGDGITGSAYWTSWSFNAVGQRTNETDHSVTGGGTDTTTSYSYNGNGASQPTTLTGTATSGPNGTSASSYTYDKDGNTTGRTLPTGAQTLSWTNTGQLATDTSASNTSSYVYDADGNQLLRQDGTTTTLFLPGEQLVLNASTQKVAGTRFIDLPGGEAVRTGSSTSYGYEIATDQHGTSTLDLDNTAQIPTWRQFTIYGAPRGNTPTTWPDQNGFLNDPTDTANGLTAIGAREYDPTIGQFISLDPQLDPTDPLSLNGYSYTDDNPVGQSDPTGQRVDDSIPGLNAAASASASNPKALYYAEQSTKRWLAQAAVRAWWRAYNHRIYLEQLRIAAAHARFVATQRARARAAALKKQAAKRSFWKLLTDNAEAMAADAGAAVVQPIPGLDAAADVGAAYLDKKAISGDLEYLSSDDGSAGDSDSTGEALSCSNSFQGSTPVLMANGASKPIDQVRVGDMITNAQPDSVITVNDQHHKVTAIHVTYDDKAYTDVTVGYGHNSATITGTAHHLYWDVSTQSWTPADKLRLGDRLLSDRGGPVVIVALRDYTTTMVTYNLTIDNTHAYYVLAGRIPVLVHNTDDCDPVLGKKLEYLFGNATGSIHNTDRSVSLESQLRRIGIYDDAAGRDAVTAHLRDVLNDEGSTVEQQDSGRVVREGILVGPNGFLRSETVWEGNKLITAKLFGSGDRYRHGG